VTNKEVVSLDKGRGKQVMRAMSDKDKDAALALVWESGLRRVREEERRSRL
jgi:hypothetical protein